MSLGHWVTAEMTGSSYLQDSGSRHSLQRCCPFPRFFLYMFSFQLLFWPLCSFFFPHKSRDFGLKKSKCRIMAMIIVPGLDTHFDELLHSSSEDKVWQWLQQISLKHHQTLWLWHSTQRKIGKGGDSELEILWWGSLAGRNPTITL